jgi:hypothetical protein
MWSLTPARHRKGFKLLSILFAIIVLVLDCSELVWAWHWKVIWVPCPCLSATVPIPVCWDLDRELLTRLVSFLQGLKVGKMLRKQQVQLQLCSINKTKTHQYFTVNCAKTTNKSFNYQKKQTHLGIELCFHIFIAQLNYSHALKKKAALLMFEECFWIFIFL